MSVLDQLDEAESDWHTFDSAQVCFDIASSGIIDILACVWVVQKYIIVQYPIRRWLKS